MRRKKRLVRSLAGLIVLAVICAGCGKKADPMPRKPTVPSISDLGVRSLPEGIVLGWSLTGSASGIGGFKIFRSETSEGSQVCPGCPQDYHPFRTVALADDRLKREGKTGFRYVDIDVKAGGFYFYRVAVCDPTGNCGDVSNESGIIHTGGSSSYESPKRKER